ncbi:MAG TPA: alpha/beta hydrolase-fold protein [Candidatus Angelobacter sp.]|nr:alpha/beta hydrolase-fold protein [Candidatus Angelobacter sp.]
MSFFTFTFGVLVLLAAAAALARTQKKTGIQSPTSEPGQKVTFRFVGPGAKQVKLQLEGLEQPAPMTRDSTGVWTIAVGPLAPGLYGYRFIADGVNLLDPNNPIVRTGLGQPQSSLLISGETPQLWEVADVPHGVVHHHFFKSGVVGDESDHYVYTPPGFVLRGTSKYPVLYLLHGYSEGADAWTAVGKANVILDNLLAQNKIKPMIVVMPLAYGTREIVKLGWEGWQNPELRRKNFDYFGKALLTELIPQVEGAYPASASREDRAIAGFSMGGAEALLIGLNHIDQFAHVGAFGTGGLSEDYPAAFPALDASHAKQLKTLWIACGTSDQLIHANRKFKGWLKSKNVPFTDVETPGGHNWLLWCQNLIAFASQLFNSD